MKRAILLGAAAATTALTLAGTSGARSDAVSFLQVTEKEWQLTLSRASVKKGTVVIEVVNFGTDNHDLVVQGKAKGSKPHRFKVIDPRGRTERTLKLPAGRYALWCSLPGHKAQGMTTTLVVRA